VHGNTLSARHLCMAIPNTTYYESLVTTNPVRKESGVQPDGSVLAPRDPGIGLAPGPAYPAALEEYVCAP
jgi:hypothetical protein